MGLWLFNILPFLKVSLRNIGLYWKVFTTNEVVSSRQLVEPVPIRNVSGVVVTSVGLSLTGFYYAYPRRIRKHQRQCKTGHGSIFCYYFTDFIPIFRHHYQGPVKIIDTFAEVKEETSVSNKNCTLTWLIHQFKSYLLCLSISKSLLWDPL